jgi:hypothetical protein
MGKGARIAAILLLAVLPGTRPPQQQPDVSIAIFPADNPWNWDISGFGVDTTNSTNYIKSIGIGTPIREDYAFPYSVVQNGQADVKIHFDSYADESDPGPGEGNYFDGTLSTYSSGYYPFPKDAPIEDGGGDRHCLVIHEGRKLLYETYVTRKGPWRAACGAVFNLNANHVRPDNWTSADAAGLPIFPGLIRYDEAIAGTIPHALRFTCSPTQDKHLYPARHDAGVAVTTLPPMGTRVRLKASKNITGYTGVARNILECLKKHGMILADNGSDWYISTTLDDRWASTNITQIRDMVGDDFEVVRSVDETTGDPILPVTGGSTVVAAAPGSGPPPSGGGGGGGGCGLLGLEILLLVAWRRRNRMGLSVR